MSGRGTTIAGWLCALAAVTLMASCNGDEGAGAGNNIPTGRGYGEPCELDVNCRTGLHCVDQACLPTGDAAEGSACTLSAECQSALYCSYEGKCTQAGSSTIGESCQTTADCESGAVCGPTGFALLCKESGAADLGGACTDTTECLAGLGCLAGECVARGDTPGFTPFVPPLCQSSIAGEARVLFEVPRSGADVTEFYRLPFPNDVRLVGGRPDLSGHRSPPLEGISGAIVQDFINLIETELDGFSHNPTIYFRFSQAIDLGSLKDGAGAARFKLFDVTADTPEYGQEHGVSWSAVSGPGSGGLYICDNWLGLRVAWGRPLRAGHTYAALVFKGIRASNSGPELKADADFSAVMSSNAPSEPELAAAHAKYAPLRQFVLDEAMNPVDIVGGTVFTVQTSKALLPAMRDVVRAQPAPTLSDLTLCDGVTTTVSPCDDGLVDDAHKRGCFEVSTAFHEIQGKVDVPIVQGGTAPYLTAADGGGIALDASGNPTVVRTESVCVAMTVPKQVTMPAEGWPLVIFAPGTGGTFRSHVGAGFAEKLASVDVDGTAAGAVVLGFEQVVHGARAGDSTLGPDVLYFNYANPAAARGHVLQGAADLFQLARLAENGWEIDAAESPTGETIRIDPSKVYLLAHSQGTHYGTLLPPYETNYRAYVFSGAGGGLIQGILGKTEPINISAGVKYALSDPKADNAFHPALNLVQTYFDVVDPINYAEYALYRVPEGFARPHIFHVFGLDDHYAPDTTQQSLAVGFGTYLVTPAPRPFDGVNTTTLPVSANFAGATAVVRQYEPDGSYDGHFVLTNHPQAEADLEAFFGTLIVNGVPELR